MSLRPITQLSRPADAEVLLEDRARWIAACERAYDKVYRGVVAMGASPADAADAVQDAVEQALRRKSPADVPEGWLFVVAVRAWKRHRWRQRLLSPLDALHAAADSVERDETIALFVELAKLTERQRTVLIARHALGLSQKEIAQLLRVAPGTVGAIASQATKKLRTRLGEER